MPRRIPSHVDDFIAAHLTSLAQLEILLLLHAGRGTSLTPEAVAEQLRIDPQWAGAEMERLRRHAILELSPDSDRAYSYAPASQSMRTAVDDVAAAYKTHRVSVITAIFARPSDSVSSFADAFRLRREDDNG